VLGQDKTQIVAKFSSELRPVRGVGVSVALHSSQSVGILYDRQKASQIEKPLESFDE
jgi:uncharacterized protein involved in propanediol utilization